MSKADIDLLIESIEKCDVDDYFEKDIEYVINKGMKVAPVNIDDLNCIEVDFIDDFEAANKFF